MKMRATRALEAAIARRGRKQSAESMQRCIAAAESIREMARSLRVETPRADVPMCDTARALPTLTERLRHWRTCQDPRCLARREQAVALGTALAQSMRSR